MKALALLILLASALPAHAGPQETVDPDTAQRLSIIGTAVPVAAIAVGTFVGIEGTKAPIRDVGAATAVAGALAGVITPSLGAFYGHHAVTGGMALRAGGLLVEAVGLTALLNHDIGDCADATPCHHRPTTYALIATGAGLYLGGAALDILHAPDFARDWNRRYELQLVPTTMHSPSSTTTGVAIAGRF